MVWKRKGSYGKCAKTKSCPTEVNKNFAFDFNEARISLKRTTEGSTYLEKKSIQMSHSIMGSKSEIAVALWNLFLLALLHEIASLILNFFFHNKTNIKECIGEEMQVYYIVKHTNTCFVLWHNLSTES